MFFYSSKSGIQYPKKFLQTVFHNVMMRKEYVVFRVAVQKNIDNFERRMVDIFRV